MADEYVYTGEEIRSIRTILQKILSHVEQTLPLSAALPGLQARAHSAVPAAISRRNRP